MELMPRITRAQSMDAPSSMATIAGYKACSRRECRAAHVSNADDRRRHDFLRPRLHRRRRRRRIAGDRDGAAAGRRVEAYDVRPAVKEQVQSLGAKFVELPIESADAEDKGDTPRPRTSRFTAASAR